MKINHTAKTISIILGIVLILGGFIWKASAFTTKVEYRLQEGENKDIAQDSSITIIKSDMAYLVRQARLKEIIDSLEKSELVIQARKIMRNNADTNTVDGTTEWSTDELEGE